MILEYLINYLTTETKICIKNVDTGATINTTAKDLGAENLDGSRQTVIDIKNKDILSIEVRNNKLYILVTS